MPSGSCSTCCTQKLMQLCRRPSQAFFCTWGCFLGLLHARMQGQRIGEMEAEVEPMELDCRAEVVDGYGNAEQGKTHRAFRLQA